MIAAQHKNDKITTTRDTKQEKLLSWEEIRFQDLFETVSIWRVTNVAWNSVPYIIEISSGVTPMGSGWANPRAPGLRGHPKGALSL